MIWTSAYDMILVLVLVETGWLCAGVTWLVHYYQTCLVDQAKDVMLGETLRETFLCSD